MGRVEHALRPFPYPTKGLASTFPAGASQNLKLEQVNSKSSSAHTQMAPYGQRALCLVVSSWGRAGVLEVFRITRWLTGKTG